MLPEFYAQRRDPEPRPEGWPRHLAQAESASVLGNATLQLEPACERSRLLRSPGADPAGARAGGEIGVRFIRCDWSYESLRPDGPLQRLPVKAKRHLGVGLELFPLAALQIGKEDESGVIEALQQHHPHRRHAVGPDRGEGHGVGIIRLAPLRLGEPSAEKS